MRTPALPLVLLALLSLVPGAAGAVIIGHHEADQVAALPQSVLDAVAGQRWLFAHASVGSNMLDGMAALHAEDAARYPFVSSWSGDGSAIYPPPASTVPGTIYDGNRGNPDWLQKLALFDDAVRNLGWRSPTIDVAMDKLCFIDDSSVPGPYLASMTALEQDFPATKFVYMTRPLKINGGPGVANIGAWEYNQAVRAHCSAGDRILLDLADIESHDPDGNPITFTVDGVTYEKLYEGYASDDGHLNGAGSRRAALGWYAAAAAVAGQLSAVPPAAAVPAAHITAIAPNPFNPNTTIRFELARPGHAELAVFDARGRLVARLVDAELPAGEHEVNWRGGDSGGRAVAAGVYVVRLVSGGESSSRRVALAR